MDKRSGDSTILPCFIHVGFYFIYTRFLDLTHCKMSASVHWEERVWMSSYRKTLVNKSKWKAFSCEYTTMWGREYEGNIVG